MKVEAFGLLTMAEFSTTLLVTLEPCAGVAERLTVCEMLPASTWACVEVRLSVQVVEAPGARLDAPQLKLPVRTPDTLSEVIVRVPALVTVAE